MTEERIHIDRRFRGPPESGNGGYVAGRLAGALGGPAWTVTLRTPPPLDQALELRRDAGGARLQAGEATVATAEPTAVTPTPPPPPTLEAAEAAMARFRGFHDHVFPGCFVCGPERPPGDGLRIFPGALNDAAGQVAAVWRPGPDLVGADGRVATAFVWAALDCPGYFAVQSRAGPAVLGRLGVTIRHPVDVGQPIIVTGWPIQADGRKHTAGTALHAADGRCLAVGLATWISIAAPA